jgi:hypothetical protein
VGTRYNGWRTLGSPSNKALSHSLPVSYYPQIQTVRKVDELDANGRESERVTIAQAVELGNRTTIKGQGAEGPCSDKDGP